MPDIYPPNKQTDDKTNDDQSKDNKEKNLSTGDQNKQINPRRGSNANNTSSKPFNMNNTGNTNPWNNSQNSSFDSPYGSNNWGGSNSFGGSNWGNNSFGNNNKPLSPDEKTEVVKKIYKEIFNRKATTRDINYYKYSTLDEDAIYKQLVNSKEHKELIKKGKDYTDVKSRADDAEGKVRQLKAQIKDQVEEFKKLTQLLKEKNRYIQQLRQQCNNPYNLVRPPTQKKPINRAVPNPPPAVQ